MAIMKSILTAGLLVLVSTAAAQTDTKCATSDVCYQLNIPADTASSGDGDIFFQLSAPSTYQYVALGQGSGMSNSQIFVVYNSADGKNVTLSPRKGTGHTEPKFSSSPQVSLLEGSGIKDGKMVANIRCSNCKSWSGGTMDFTASSGDWIHAYKSSGELKSDDTNAGIDQHTDAAAFQFDFSAAKGGDSLNPFVAASASGTAAAPTGTSGGKATAAPTGTTSCVPRPTTGTFASEASAVSSIVASVSSWPSTVPNDFRTAFPTNIPSEWRSHWPTARPTGNFFKRDVNYCETSSNNGNTLTPIVSSEFAQQRKMLIAHGTLAALAFVIFFPAGAISIRLCSFPGIIWLHAAFQVFAYAVYLAAFGLGVYVANEKDLLNNYHPIIGIVLFVVIFFQPIFGFLHHALFKKYNGRTLWSYVHIWIGRIAITLGIINGGLGFKLANPDGVGSHNGMIVYAVVGALVWLLMVFAAIVGERKRKSRSAQDAPPKYEEQAMDTPLQSLNPSQERAPGGAHGYYGQQPKP